MLSLGDVLSSIITAFLQLFPISRRENHLRSMLMLHKAVFWHFNRINKEINDEFDGFDIRIFGIVWFIIALCVGIVVARWNGNISSQNAAVVSILVASAFAPVLSPKKKGRLIAAIFNISIPVSILGSVLFVFPLISIHYTYSTRFVYVFFAFLLEVLWLLGVSRGPLISKGRELYILRDKDNIKGSAFGLIITFVISGMYAVMWILNPQGDIGPNWLDLVMGMFGMIILAYLISNIKETTVRLLWKAQIRTFADDLPKIIVTTVSGGIFFGRLYDPLDNNVLIIRDAGLLHNDQKIEALVGFASNYWFAGNYWIVPWDDIESIKILEDGLYEPVDLDNDESESLIDICR